MPKLDDTHLPSRISKRIEKLERGEEVPAKDIRAVLTEAQYREFETLWAKQQELRKAARPKTDEEKSALGWKSKRDVYWVILQQALDEALAGQLAAYEALLEAKELRRARIYFDSLNASEAKGIKGQQAKDIANNELTRAGLRRLDKRDVYNGLTKRDREVRKMEEDLLRSFEAELSPAEREEREAFRNMFD